MLKISQSKGGFVLKAKTSLIVLVLAALIAGAAWGQTGNGSVRGVVEDQTGAVIPNVNVVLVNTATNVQARTVTNNVGLYVYPVIVPGPYKVIVEHPGMAKFEGAVTVRVQESETVNVVLKAASTATTIEVLNVTPMVKTDSTELGQTLESRRIEELPINGRNVMNLLATVPGTSTDSYGRFRTFGTGHGTHDVTIDGAPLTDMVYGGGTVKAPPSLESVQEFTVQTSSIPAWSARPTDIVMVTKGGTNELHGSLFETNRDNFVFSGARARNAGNKAAKLVRNEFGGSVGGPLYIPKVYNGKNKTFWFFSHEELRQRTGDFGRWRVPTEAMRNGDFSNIMDSAHTPQKIYDPFTTDPVTHLRQQFMYNGQPNVINPALMSPLYKYILSVVPLPNQSGVNPFLASNYFGPTPVSRDSSTWVIRIDQHLSDTDQLYGRFSNATWKTLAQGSGGVPTLDAVGNTRLDAAPNRSASLDWTHSFSPSFFNETMFSFTRSLNSTSQPGDPTTKYSDMLNLPNPASQPGYPVIGDIGLTGGNNYISSATVRAEFFNYFILEDNATKLIGKHELRFGAHLRYDQLTYLPQQQRAAGGIGFPSIATALYDPNYPTRSRSVLNTGSVAASAFIGAATYNYRLVKGKYYLRRNEDALYFQDNFRATKRLTLNLGLRWDYNPWPQDISGVFSSFDLTNNAVVLGAPLSKLYALGAALPGYVTTSQQMGVKYEMLDQTNLPHGFANNNWHDLGPHVGFAYRALEGKKSFVLRGAYALSFYPITMWGWNDRMKANAPFLMDLNNSVLTSPEQSPDGIRNYGLISTPTVIAGKNSRDVITANNLTPDKLVGYISEAFFNPDQPSSRVHTWHLTLEKELMPDTVLRLSYQGNHTSNLDAYSDLNQYMNDYDWYVRKGTALPEGLYADSLTRPMNLIPYSNIQEWNKNGWANANGGTVELQRRFSKGLGFQAFYQLVNSAKAGGHGWYGDSALSPVTAYPAGEVPDDVHARMKLLMYGRDITIPKQEVRFNWIAELPFGRGRLLGRNMPKYLNAIAGGWQISGMGRFRQGSFPVLSWDNLYPTGNPVEYYGRKYPIQDCRSGRCEAGYLLTNGYIPAHQINQPNGIMGVPADYKPAVAPVNPYPADYLSLDPSSYHYYWYGSNLVNVTLKDGTQMPADKSDLNPYINNYINGTWQSNTDASIFKTFTFKESMRLKFQADFFNVFNQPGTDFTPQDSTGTVLKNYSTNSPRTMQLSARFTW